MKDTGYLYHCKTKPRGDIMQTKIAQPMTQENSVALPLSAFVVIWLLTPQKEQSTKNKTNVPETVSVVYTLLIVLMSANANHNTIQQESQNETEVQSDCDVNQQTDYTKQTLPEQDDFEQPRSNKTDYQHNNHNQGHNNKQDANQNASTKKPKMSVKQAAKILGISVNATVSELKKAYHNLLKRWHPDKNPNDLQKASKITRLINKAYKMMFKHIKANQKNNLVNPIRQLPSTPRVKTPVEPKAPFVYPKIDLKALQNIKLLNPISKTK